MYSLISLVNYRSNCIVHNMQEDFEKAMKILKNNEIKKFVHIFDESEIFIGI